MNEHDAQPEASAGHDVQRGRARAIHLARRPEGFPSPDDFTVVEYDLPELAPGAALVRNLYLSVDPYMRESMHEGWEIGRPGEGRALGRVVASTESALPVGTLVAHRQAWRTHAVVTAENAQRLPEYPGVPVSAHLGLLGGTGLTAYVGLTRVAKLRAGETLLVSAAAGGVGSAARIIGSTGSDAKAAYLTERLGFDAAVNYRAAVPLVEQLRQAAPDGVDVYLDNVGGDHLAAAIDVLKPYGRVAWSGAVAQYHNLDRPPAAPYNLYDVVWKRLRIEGFLVRDHLSLRDELLDVLVPRIAAGELTPVQTVVDGFENTVEAFLRMLRGENVGKMLVRLGDD
jgi:NADPH-dependent curcumin reductase CurA